VRVKCFYQKAQSSAKIACRIGAEPATKFLVLVRQEDQLVVYVFLTMSTVGFGDVRLCTLKGL
jgi:hypothetical protein